LYLVSLRIDFKIIDDSLKIPLLIILWRLSIMWTMEKCEPGENVNHGSHNSGLHNSGSRPFFKDNLKFLFKFSWTKFMWTRIMWTKKCWFTVKKFEKISHNSGTRKILNKNFKLIYIYRINSLNIYYYYLKFLWFR
jgi:hypothetical protein